VVYGFHQAWQQTGMPYYLLEGAIFILGAAFHALRLPESARPGKFDILGGSHNIFHVLVVIATFVHLAGIWQHLDTITGITECVRDRCEYRWGGLLIWRARCDSPTTGLPSFLVPL
jgi:adiponectin receptor